MRTSVLYSLALVAILFAARGVAFAEAAAKPGDQGASSPAEKDKTAFMGIKRYDLAIYTLIVFGLLILVLGKFAWKPVMDGLQKREDSIAGAHADAEKAKAEAEKLLAEIKAQRAKTNDEVVAILAEARRDADRFRESEKVRTAGDIQADRERLKREIETARDQALQEIWDKTVQLSTLMSSKAIGRATNEDDHRRLIDEALGELNEKIAETKA